MGWDLLEHVANGFALGAIQLGSYYLLTSYSKFLFQDILMSIPIELVVFLASLAVKHFYSSSIVLLPYLSSAPSPWMSGLFTPVPWTLEV